MNDDRKQRVISYLEAQMEAAATTLAKFREEVAEHPAGAFEWADSAMFAAAVLDVFKPAVAMLRGGADLAEAAGQAMKDLILHAGNQNCSTSPCKNAMDAARQKARGRLADYLR